MLIVHSKAETGSLIYQTKDEKKQKISEEPEAVGKLWSQSSFRLHVYGIHLCMLTDHVGWQKVVC